MRRTLALVAVLLLARAPVAADDLAALLEGDPGAAAVELRRRGADPAEVVGRLRRVDVPAAPTGRDSTIEITGGDGRRSVARVLVPASYDPSRPTPLLIALHGKGGDENQLTRLFQPAVEKGWLVACPAARRSEGTGDLALTLMSRFGEGEWWTHGPDSLVLATLDMMNRRFHVDPDRVVLTGYSMGGFGTWNVGLRFHHRFAGLAPMAGGMSLVEYAGVRDRRTRSLLANARNVELFVMHGDADETVPIQGDQWSHEELERLGFDHRFHRIEGGRHMLPFLRRQGEAYADFWIWLEGCRRDPAPSTMIHVAIEKGPRTGEWMEILDAPEGTIAIGGRLEEGNRIVIETSRVDRFRLYPPAGAVDCDRPVTVVVDGRTVHEGPIEPSLEAVVASWRAFAGDRRKVTDRALVIEP